MKKIFKMGLVIIKDGKMLFVKEFGVNEYFCPGGKAEEGETPEQTLKREVKEELGAELDMATLEFIETFEDNATVEPDTLVNIRLFSGEIVGNFDFKPCGEIEKLKWFGKNDDWSELSSINKNKIMPYLVERGLIK